MTLGRPWPILGHITSMATMPVYGKYLLFQNHQTKCFETYYVALYKWVLGHFQSLNLFFCRNSWAIWNQSLYESWGRMGMKIYTNELGHMANMAAMSIYGKNL